MCDAQVMMMSLPWILGLNSLPVFQPYLRACSERVESWAQRLPSTRWKIGICAEGSKDFEADALRSMGLSWFRDLASQEGVTCVSLQKKIEVSTVGFPLTVFSDLDAGKDAFLDTAALMQSLDLVVTSDTSVAHLAGALGRPVWVMLPFSPDWRWQLHSENSPWYPSMRLFRQAEPKNWHTPFADMREAFRRQYAGTF